MRYNNSVGNVDIRLDTSRIDGNLRNAQKLLNMQVVADCDQYVPFQQGALRGSVQFPDGIYGGEIEYATPYAHYQYQGELYLTKSGSPYAEKGEKKYPTGVPLVQHTAGTASQWFEEAKRTHREQWIDLVRREVGKG